MKLISHYEFPLVTQIDHSEWLTARDVLRRRRAKPAKDTELKKKTGDRHGSRTKQLEWY